ncbi:glucosyltransferase domain-containing protein [Blautia sp. HCP28S3_G10]|uniref:glucosyltransferase domain-containing protein n=1 Tax=Blautia sp. HCP28S3_G10 TaxID=3438908 RepID=UPI003F8AA341
MKEKINSIQDFFRKHIVLVVLIVLSVVVFYVGHAMTTNIGIDTEQYIMGDYGKEWIITGLGRLGYYYFIMFLNLWHYNPYANGVAFLAIFSMAILAWIYVFYMINGKSEKYKYIIFGVALLTNPLWAAHFYFTLQQGAIALAFLIQAISFALLLDVLINNRKNTKFCNTVELLGSVICAFMAIGTYQTFPGLHLAEAAACLLILFDKMTEKDNSLKVHKSFWIKTIIVIIHFVVSYLMYSLVCKVFNFGTSDYLQFKWGTRPTTEIIQSLWLDFKNILLGRDAYAGWILLLSIILLVILVFENFLEKKNIWLKLDYLLLCVGNIICMIALNIVIGGIPADRARLPVAFTTAFLGMYTFSKCCEVFKTFKIRQIIVVPAAIVLIISLLSQSGRSQTLFYTDDICNMQQYQVGADIVKNIETLEGDAQATIIVVGKWDAPLNASCRRQSLVGNSSFDWDYNVEDPISGTRRSVLYLNAAFGKKYNRNIDDAQKSQIIETAKTMPKYPENGYVEKMDNIYIVKLSDF